MMDYSKDFMDKLHNQTSEMAAPKEKKDKAIMKVLGSWARKGTDEYKSFTRKEEAGPLEYLANHGKRAGVDRSVAWDYTVSALGKDMSAEEIQAAKERFDQAYDSQDYEEWWRKKKFWYVK